MSRPTSYTEALRFPTTKPLDGQQMAYAHRKLDGHMLQVSRNLAGVVNCFTRQKTNITEQVQRFGFAVPFWSLPHNTVLYGELWTPGKAASYTKTALKERDTSLTFTAFAAWSEGVDLAQLPKAEDFCIRLKVPFAQWWWRHEVPEELTPDTEGYVWKDETFGLWYKWKPVKTIDLVVSGTLDGKGKHLGLLGSLKLSTSCGTPVGKVGTGLTDLERCLDPEQIVGKVVEVAYDRVDSKGSLRFPRFVRVRDDKRRNQCPLSQDPELKAFHK